MALRTALALCLCVALPVPAKAQDGSLPATAYDRLNLDVVARRLIPDHRAFEAAAGDLASSAERYCAASDPASLDDLRQHYHAAADAWMALQWVGFGPSELDQRSFRIQFWPDNRNNVSRQLGGVLAEPRQDLLDPAVLAGASVALQGFPALERLLFGDAAPGDDAYVCGLTVSISRNLATMSADLAAAWDPQPGDPAASARQALDGMLGLEPVAMTGEFYQSMFELLEAIARLKLQRPMGGSVEEARPRRGEAWRSGRSMRNIRLNLIAIRAVAENGEATGFADLLRDDAGQARAADSLLSVLDDAIALAESLDGPYETTLVDADRRDGFEKLLVAVNRTRDVFGGPMGRGLGLRIGFNSMDGD